MYSGPERRKSKRVNVNFSVVYRVNAALSAHIMIEGETDIDALMLDLSQDGAAFLTNYDIPIGTIVRFKFTLIDFSLPSERRVNNLDVVAKIVSNVKVKEKEYRLGIYFTHITENDRIAIAEFVKNKGLFQK